MGSFHCRRPGLTRISQQISESPFVVEAVLVSPRGPPQSGADINNGNKGGPLGSAFLLTIH